MEIKNLEELESFAHDLSALLIEGDVINLVGEMGAGKTTLTSLIAKELGIDDSSSPTFALVNIYEGDKKIYHLDLYRLDDPDDILDIDFEEYFYPTDAISFIEWAENAKDYLPDEMIDINIDKIDERTRDITISDKSQRGREINAHFSN